MAGTIKIVTTIAITDLRGQKCDLSFTDSISTLTAITHMDFAITADQTRIIWDPTVGATENVADFDRMILIADGILDIELTIFEGDANEELNSFRLVKDIPFMLGADDAWSNHSASDCVHIGRPNKAHDRLLHYLTVKSVAKRFPRQYNATVAPAGGYAAMG